MADNRNHDLDYRDLHRTIYGLCRQALARDVAGHFRPFIPVGQYHQGVDFHIRSVFHQPFRLIGQSL